MSSRLKSLELQGYKTFANRTFFGFSETITAIVGPNGSGKSNIADSIRWVLGEQSYSLLRARKTEDMIFSGSEKRSRAGLASATITFDNSDDWLPIDFSEVAITRRAHRDGQNEYLVNGQRVRLKDVSELLSESGLAERTYTVIGQGLVDAALSLRADERRRLFEEAAGIGLHRSRREESIRRLDQTQRNMERVEDILAELKPRLNSLERQARRAQEYEQVRADLQALLHEWYGYHWHESQNDLSQATENEKLQEGRLSDARSEQDVIETQLSTLREKIQSKREQLNAWHKALSVQHLRREEAIRTLAAIDERKRFLLSQQENETTALMNLEADLRFAEGQAVAAAKEIGWLKEELEEAAQQASEALERLKLKQAQRQTKEEALQSIQLRLADLNAQLGRQEAQLIESQNQENRLREQINNEQKNLEEAQAKWNNDKAFLSTASENVRQVEKELLTVQRNLDDLRGKIHDLELKTAKIRDQRTLELDEHTRLKAELEVLEQAETAFVGYASGTRLLLQAARENRLKGAQGALSAFIDVPGHLEKAISAALGDYLDAVILDDDPDQALDLLDAESGRAVLLPLKRLRVDDNISRLPKIDEDYLGEASDLVRAKPEFAPVIRVLLRGVMVVKDRVAARRLLLDHPSGWRIVTLRGEVFHPSGAIFSGSAEGDRSILGRARQKREAAAESLSLEKKLRKTESIIHQFQSQNEELETEESKTEVLHEESHQKYLKTIQIRDQASSELEKAEREVNWHKNHLDRLEDEILQRTDEADFIQSSLASITTEIKSERQALIECERDLMAITLDEDQTQQAHWNTRLAVVEQSMLNAETRLQERQQALERSRTAYASLKEKISNLSALIQESQDAGHNAASTENEVGELIHQLNAKIEPTEIELGRLDEQQAVLQEKSDSSRRQVSLVEHIHSQARIELARKQEGLRSLQRRIEDDIGLVNFEYVEQVSVQTPLPLIGMVEQLPLVWELPPDIEENIKRQRAQLRRMGSVNLDAQAEYVEVRQRYEFLTNQMSDLQKAEQDIRKVIQELDEMMKREFQTTFDAVAEEFRQIFIRIFGGGFARLVLTDPDDVTMTGIEIEARLPGRRAQGLSLLSGGERSLTATALVFALLKVSPTPFCVLDEVDAMLDEANVGRFSELLRELSQQTQFVIVTHNRNTVQAADVIYGVTMGKDSSSQVLSLKLDEVGTIID